MAEGNPIGTKDAISTTEARVRNLHQDILRSQLADGGIRLDVLGLGPAEDSERGFGHDEIGFSFSGC